MIVRINDNDDDWPGRQGEAFAMDTCEHEPRCVWVQFDDGEGGEYPLSRIIEVPA